MADAPGSLIYPLSCLGDVSLWTGGERWCRRKEKCGAEGKRNVVQKERERWCRRKEKGGAEGKRKVVQEERERWCRRKEFCGAEEIGHERPDGWWSSSFLVAVPVFIAV